MDQSTRLRPARAEDADFAWRVYAEAVKPSISPYIATHFNREWKDDEEKSRFATWWTPESTSIITVANEQVGWFHYEETDAEITLVNFCILAVFRRQGVGSKVLGQLLEGWKTKQKPVIHSVLKSGPYRGFFEHFGFQVTGEDEITFLMKRPAAIATAKASAN